MSGALSGIKLWCSSCGSYEDCNDIHSIPVSYIINGIDLKRLVCCLCSSFGTLSVDNPQQHLPFWEVDL